MRIVIGLGGNALLRRGERPDADVQLAHLAAAAPALARIAAEHEVVIVHGNGPQVGLLAMESVSDTTLSRPYPLGDLVAETQGVIGYWIQQALTNAGLARPVVTLVTQTVVDGNDPAFLTPTKYVGSGYPEEVARLLASRNGWSIRKDGADWRRVVSSPRPRRVVELDAAELLLRNRITVIFAGGGGIPVAEGPAGLVGVEAVVDKDFAAALIATELRADLLVMLTDVPAVYLDYGTASQRPLRQIDSAELASLTFPDGSMGPKATAALRFVEATHGRAAIGSLDEAASVVEGTTGTQITLPSSRD
ncbi:carbamate kinase [Kribbella sp. VKM Ac-2527]|uniref:Carbamate kinase n=1 Tax=Kribbella caucasensis TaxID=2512215 RepID=A0A4R6K904_9ACTN|nr:carbamate kinase [Kribbella sp. VKM Ac-2527]TDO46199.1 carbamate kinase [Kribbella sp. VKM Ac-2527]